MQYILFTLVPCVYTRLKVQQTNKQTNTQNLIGLLHDPVTRYGINYAGTLHSGTFKHAKELVPVQPDFRLFLKVPPCNLRPSIIYSVPCDWTVQRAHLKKNNPFEHWL